MLGHLGKGNLAAGSLSICYLNMVWFFIQGSISSQSRALLRASEELDKLEIRVICYSLLIQSFLLSILATGIMVVSPFVLPIIIPQNHNVAFKACQQLYFFIPVLWCMVVFRITQICLRYHNIWRHTLLSLLIGNILNIIANYVLIFSFGFGFIGCSIATVVSRFCMLALLIFFTLRDKTFRRVPMELHFILLSIITWCRRTRSLGKGAVYKIGAADTASFDNSRSINTSTSRRARENELREDYLSDSDNEIELAILQAGTGLSSSSSNAKSKNQATRARELGNSKITSRKNSKNNNRRTRFANNDDNESDNEEQEAEEEDGGGDNSTGDGRISSTNNEDKESAQAEGEAEELHLLGSNRSVKPSSSSSSSGRGNSNSNDSHVYRNKHLIVPESLSDVIDRKAFLKRKRKHFMRFPLTVLRRKVMRQLVQGCAPGLFYCLEFWYLEFALFTLARMGTVVICTQQVISATTCFFFLSIPFALSLGIQSRIQHQLASSQVDGAVFTSRMGLTLSLFSMLLSAFWVYFLGLYLGRMFTSDNDVPGRVVELSLFVSIYQLLLGVQACVQGIYLGTGSTSLLIGLKFLSQWVCGLPTGLYLNYFARPSFGLTGVWIGLVTGLGLETVVLLFGVCFFDWNREMVREKLRGKKEKEYNQVDQSVWVRELNTSMHEGDSSDLEDLEQQSLTKSTQEGEDPAERSLINISLTEKDGLDEGTGVEDENDEQELLAAFSSSSIKRSQSSLSNKVIDREITERTLNPLVDLLSGLVVNPEAELRAMEEEEDALAAFDSQQQNT